VSHEARPTWICEHGYLDSLGCDICDMPLQGYPIIGAMLVLGVLVAVVMVFLGVRWIGNRLETAEGPGPAGVAGAWCGTASETMRVTLADPDGPVLSGQLKMGQRTSTLIGRLFPRDLVVLRTVGSTLQFELSGALVGDRLQLNVVDDAGDTGRVELQRC
jgi:hypothetical protein